MIECNFKHKCGHGIICGIFYAPSGQHYLICPGENNCILHKNPEQR